MNYFIDLDNEGYNTKSPRIYVLLAYEETDYFLKLVVKINDEKITIQKKKKYCIKIRNVIIYSENNVEFFS